MNSDQGHSKALYKIVGAILGAIIGFRILIYIFEFLLLGFLGRYYELLITFFPLLLLIFVIAFSTVGVKAVTAFYGETDRSPEEQKRKLEQTCKIIGAIAGLLIGIYVAPYIVGFFHMGLPIPFGFAPWLSLLLTILFSVFGAKSAVILVRKPRGEKKRFHLSKWWQMPKVPVRSKIDWFIVSISVSVFSVTGFIFSLFALLIFARKMDAFLWLFIVGDNPTPIVILILSRLVLLSIVGFIIINFIRAGFKIADSLVARDIRRLKPQNRSVLMLMIILSLILALDSVAIFMEVHAGM